MDSINFLFRTYVLTALFLGINIPSFGAPAISCQQAQSMFKIAPDQSSFSMGQNDSHDIVYTITNTTGMNLPLGVKSLALSVKPLSSDLSVSVVATSGCSTLNNNQKCNQTVRVTTNKTAAQAYSLSALICDAGKPTKFCATTCSPVIINVNSKPTPPKPTKSTQAYITEQFGPLVKQCKILSTGALSGCSSTPLTNPFAVALNASGTIAYVVNSPGDTLVACSLNSNGAITSCTDTNATHLSDPQGIALNPAGTIAYITNHSAGSITRCTVNGTSVDNCQELTNINLFGPRGLVSDLKGALYVANSGGATVAKCSGSPLSCNDFITGVQGQFLGPWGVALNTLNTKIYVTDNDGEHLVQCDISNDEAQNCTILTSPLFDKPAGIAVNKEQSLAYITNYGNGTAYRCPLKNGVINTALCIKTLSFLSFPSAIALN